jgi:hypothetical protein
MIYAVSSYIFTNVTTDFGMAIQLLCTGLQG